MWLFKFSYLEKAVMGKCMCFEVMQLSCNSVLACLGQICAMGPTTKSIWIRMHYKCIEGLFLKLVFIIKNIVLLWEHEWLKKKYNLALNFCRHTFGAESSVTPLTFGFTLNVLSNHAAAWRVYNCRTVCSVINDTCIIGDIHHTLLGTVENDFPDSDGFIRGGRGSTSFWGLLTGTKRNCKNCRSKST